MSFTDPLSVTILPAGAVSLPRTSVGDDESEYTSADGLIQVKASHNYGKRTRRMWRIDTSKMAPDPFRPSENVKVSMSMYIVFDLPPSGFTAAEAKAVFDASRVAWAASSDQQITKLLGGES